MVKYPIIAVSVLGASLMQGSAEAHEVNRRCKTDISPPEYQLMTTCTERDPIPRGGAYTNE